MNLYLLYSALRARFGVFALVVCATIVVPSAVRLNLPGTGRAPAPGVDPDL